MAGGHLRSCPRERARTAGVGVCAYLGAEGFGEQKSVQDPGHRRGAGAAGWEPQWWLRHVLWWLLGAKDSVACPGRNVGAPRVPSHSSRLPRSCWGGRGLRGAGVPPAPTGSSRGLWVQVQGHHSTVSLSTTSPVSFSPSSALPLAPLMALPSS